MKHFGYHLRTYKFVQFHSASAVEGTSLKDYVEKLKPNRNIVPQTASKLMEPAVWATASDGKSERETTGKAH